MRYVALYRDEFANFIVLLRICSFEGYKLRTSSVKIYQMIPKTLVRGLFHIQHENRLTDLAKFNIMQSTQSSYLSFG